MLALSDAGLAEKLHAYKAGLAAKVEQKDREISAEYAQ